MLSTEVCVLDTYSKTQLIIHVFVCKKLMTDNCELTLFKVNLHVLLETDVHFCKVSSNEINKLIKLSRTGVALGLLE